MNGAQLQFSPGRIDPTNAAFNSSRKPLAGEFTFNGSKLFVIANHFNSKGGDQPLFGRFQPPLLTSEVQRKQQAQIVNTFVKSILAADAKANIVVLGDFNDFEFSEPIKALKGGVLTDLIETLPANERYTYVFEGNSQTLDHILVSSNLLAQTTLFDVVHVNAEFADQISDHDPSVAYFALKPSEPCAIDVSNSVSVTRFTPRFNRITGRVVQQVALKNTSHIALSGPLFVMLEGLSSNATLFNKSGLSVCDGMGNPYITLAAGLPVGASATITLEFVKTGSAATPITYATAVLQGPGKP